jgi:UDP:flavonoid glycosyltransferase YjiC (YdhE family)
MSRFLFTTLPGTAHLNASATIARAVSERGHEVLFASSRSFCPAVEVLGFECAPSGLDWLEPELAHTFPELRRLRPGSPQSSAVVMDLLAGRIAGAMAADLREIALAWEPSAIVCDLLEFGGCLVAEAAGIPHASCGPTYFSDRRAFEASVRGPLGRHRQAMGLRPTPVLQMIYRQLDLAFGTPAFLGAEGVGSDTCFLRPEIADAAGDETLPTWLEDRSSRPLILGTMGTVFGGVDDLLGPIATALAGAPFDVVLTTGRNRAPDAFGALPANFFVTDYIPYSLLLPRCDLVIAHGGSLTVASTLFHGVPMLLLPIAGDHFLSAKRCEQVGAGIALASHQRTPGAIRATAETLLADLAFHSQARAVSRSFQRLPGAAYAAELLEQIVDGGLRSPALATAPAREELRP